MKIQIFKESYETSQNPDSLESKVNNFIKGKKVINILQNSVVHQIGTKYSLIITVLYEE
ncbi:MULTISPECIES: hypothetical protein [Clostridium]|uniref:hypothetical protein n=1 Tax=Clostridium TaxID=1485 RepID=UPI0015E7B30F|nr:MULTISPECIES: hypothetical protein [Clostridium]